ncbi:hypothetical protein SAMN05216241_1172 [Limimonas halophila]|uniref:General secretion pathway protein N n=1 Tax=Limimonas halophila TaxID=1082479 RepID=A0A1G7UUH3_9PROT|nr:hypothetical protein [Limimonas halophila]SDG50968.1 hypothetical protein SAMN05216241_1172 [Limimonas halophila]
MRRRRWPAVVPVLAMGVLAAALGHRVQATLETPAGASLGPHTPADVAISVPDPELPRFEPPRSARFSVIVRRNLFSPERQPPPRDTDEDAAKQAEADTDADSGPDDPSAETAPTLNATLAGVVLAGSNQRAIVVTGDGGTKHQLAPGERVAGWRLIRVTAQAATFRRDGTETRLTLPFAATVSADDAEPTQKASAAGGPTPEQPADRITPVNTLDNTPGFLADEQLPGGIPAGEDSGAEPVTPRAKRSSESGKPARARNQSGVSDRVDKYRDMGGGE